MCTVHTVEGVCCDIVFVYMCGLFAPLSGPTSLLWPPALPIISLISSSPLFNSLHFHTAVLSIRGAI